MELWPSVPGAKASVPGPAICPGRSFPKLGAFRRLGRRCPEAWGLPGRLPGTFQRIFLKACPASEGEPARRLALNCDVFDERSQCVPHVPKPKAERASSFRGSAGSCLSFDFFGAPEILGK